MIFASRWLLPIDRPPLERGWIETDGGTIVRLGSGPPPGPATDLGNAALLPGLVNAHTHLELSWLRGRVPPAGSFIEWLRTLLAVRGRGALPALPEQLQAMRAGIEEARATGTVLVGDISNTLVTPALLASAGMSAVVFHELLGFNVVDATTVVAEARSRLRRVFADARAHAADGVDLRGRVVAHAPYSVAPDLFRRIARLSDDDAPLSVHVGESVEELELLRVGTGPMRALLEDLGVWTERWQPPGTGPVAWLDTLGYLQPGTLAVHAVHLDESDIDRLVERDAVVVICARSNVWVGTGLPRVSHLYAAGARIAIGTDSLASVGSLNMFDELAELRRVAPDVTAASLLESATRTGAEALGAGDRYGTLAPGKAAALVAVDVPAGVRDVEEYLVGGVPPEAIRPVPT